MMMIRSDKAERMREAEWERRRGERGQTGGKGELWRLSLSFVSRTVSRTSFASFYQ